MLAMNDLRLRLREEGGTFVRDYRKWTVWGTVTYWNDVAEEWVREDIKLFLRKLAKDHQTHFWFALGMEEQVRGVLHAHLLLALLEITTDDAARRLRGRWGKGRSVFELYKPKDAAAYYLHGHRQWELQVACPRPPRCRREHGCLEAPGPW